MSQKFYSEVKLEALNNATVDTDHFLVGDSGTIKYRTGAQLLSDLGIAGIYVPYTGATGNVDLGTHTLSSYNLIVNHTSGSGVAASITKGGNGEALTINKTSGSGNAMSVTGGLTSLVDLSLSSIANATIDTDRFIVSDGGTIKYRTGAEVLSDIGGQAALTNPITGTGTTNYVSKFTGTTSLGNSQIFDNGTNVGVGTTSPPYKFSVYDTSDGVVGHFGGGVSNYALISFRSNEANVYSTSLGSYNSGMLFRTGATDRMYITSTGNVGIGTTSPGYPLEVNGAIVSKGGGTGGLDGTIGFGSTGTSLSGNALLGEMYFKTGGSEKMRINIAGNVGIGTTSPNFKLGIQASEPTFGILQAISNNNGGNATLGAKILFDVSGIGNFWEGMPSGANAWAVGLYNGSTNPEYMRITSSGNVGIGTSSPSGKFQVIGAAGKLYIDDSGVGYNYYDASNAHNFRDFAGTSRLYINTSTGNVGIGTTAPTLGKLVSKDSSYQFIAEPTDTATYGYLGMGQFTNGAFIGTTAGTNSASDILRLGTGGAERMRITSAGNVGIGTTSPTQKLDVNGAINTNKFFRVGDSSTLIGAIGSQFEIFGTGGNDWSFYNANATSNVFYTSGTEKMRITPGGTVGIGTSVPYSKLDVQDYTSFLSLSSSINSEATTNNQQIGGIDFRKHYSLTIGASIRQLQAGGTSNYSNAHLAFYTNNGSVAFGSVPPERMRITDTGNVGIGTSSPSNYSGYTTLSINNTSSGGLIDLQNNGTSALRISADSSTQVSIYGATTVPMVFSTNATERMRVTAGGLVGIGTSNPSVRLDVNGNLSMGDGANGDQNIKIRYGNFSSGYGAIRFTESGTNNSTIHSFSSAWQGGDIYEHSTGSININGFNGVTFGAWNDVDIVFNTGGTNYFRSLVGIGTTNPTKLLDVNGDALISGLTIGLGGGFSSSNTALGNNALLSNTTGNYSTAVGLWALQNSQTGVQNVAVGSLALTNNVSGGNCVAIGYGAGGSSNATGLTVIGANLALDTNLNTLGKDCLAISQFNSNATTAQVPHIYAPEPISVPNGTTPNIITFDNDHYAGAIVEYMIRLDDGGNYAMGTVYMGWKSSGSGNMKDIRQIVWNDMSDFVFDTNGGTTLSLANTSGSNAWVRITVRGIMNN